ncbi:MAG TPA: c-type cytochrome [Zeimonas sp.]|nr:c-type cytochrome [Zeimonas sp.]
MKRISLVVLLALFAWSVPSQAAETQPREQGIEAPDYIWNEMYAEKLQALKAKGDTLRGEIAFEVCQGCHRAKALGRVDGTYPRLAGQHATVLIKQMTDVRAGRRDNQRMYPFVDMHVLGPQEIADIAVFLQKLPVPPDNGKGDGSALERGRALYEADCANCHGERGEGDEAKFYPRVSGQHYLYLLREGIEIRDGRRRNANPKMVKVVKGYSDADMRAVSDYMSRFDVSR